MNNSIASDYLKNKKNDFEQKINDLANIERNQRQETIYQALLLEKDDLEIRICKLESCQPLDLSTRDYSLNEDTDSASDISERTNNLLESEYIRREIKIYIIQKRRMQLQTKQKTSILITHLNCYYYYYYFLLLYILFFIRFSKLPASPVC